jgi:TonB-dependent starch-binding outer membrane protein SusC
MNKEVFKKVLILVVFLSGNVFFAQTVKGKVTSGGATLPGVNVVIKGTKTGVSTGFTGEFEISKVPANATLVFSFIGYNTKEVPANFSSPMNVVLAEDTKSLNEVVVVGYGTVKRKDLTGSISSINSSAIKNQPFSSLDQALQGKVAGVTVTQNSGAPGGGVSVRVRGITSLGGNEPLYVIDGVQVSGSSNNDSFNFSSIGGGNGQTKVNALSNINPSDIESIDVLKDGAAAAIYGASASNGVVLVTTKKGKKGKSILAYDTYSGFQQVAKFVKVLNLKEYGQFIKEVYPTAGLVVPYEYRNPELLGEGTNWQDEIFRSALTVNHQLSFSGAKDNTKFYTSLNYFSQDGIVINSNFKRYSMRLNLENKLNNWFKFGNNLTFGNSRENVTFNDDESGVISGAIRQSPAVPVRLSDGSFGGPDPAQGLGSGNGKNAVATSEIRNNYLNRYKLNGNFYGEISFAKNLTFRTDFGYDYTTSKNSIFNPTYKIGNDINDVNQSIKINSDSFFWVFKNYLTYSKSFGKHDFTVLLGQEAQQNKYEGITASRKKFPGNNLDALGLGDATTATNDNYKGTHSISSYFGRLNYSFDNKYVLTASIRSDASSNFGPNNRIGYFPAISGAWILSNESFMKPLTKVLSYAKFRAGYSTVGNENIEAYSFGSKIASVNNAFGTAYLLENIENANVKWETTISENYGVELGFLEDAIRIDLDYYKKTSSDFLFPQPTPGILGSSPTGSFLGLKPPVVNLGEMVNEGIDFTLNTRNIAKENFTWNTTIVFSKFRNKLTKLADENSTIFRTIEFNNTITKTTVGESVGQFYGYVVEGIYKTEAELYSSPTPKDPIDRNTGVWLGDIKFKDVNGDGKIDDNDRTYIGSPIPDFTYGITNTLSYHNFDFSFVLQGSQGNEIYNWTRRLTEGMKEVNANQGIAVKDRFIENVNTNTNVPRFKNGDPGNNSRVSSRFVEDGSFLRIQNLTLGYSLAPKYLERTKLFSKVRIYGSAQNIYTFTKYSGLDPDIGSFNQDALLSGVDNGRYPVPKVFLMGLNIEF